MWFSERKKEREREEVGGGREGEREVPGREMASRANRAELVGLRVLGF